ncbi:MAG TPA: hypothetical protein VGU01_08260 [Sphingomicrobium sp.]|nr:hypothetical protein [Sphingomicrobium sp.]
MLTIPGEGAELRQQAAHCRRLADSCLNGRLARILDRTADEFEEEAERMEKLVDRSRGPMLRCDVTPVPKGDH